MKRILVLLAVLALSCAASPRRVSPKQRLDGRIVGGQNASITDHPYIVSLQNLGSHICGGSIISIRAVVTAAHCTDGSSANALSIRAGSTLFNSGGTVVNIGNFTQHPLYDWWTIDWDLSILFPVQTLTLGPTIAVVGLPYQSQEFPAGQLSAVTGWGHLFEGSGVLSQNLQVVNVPIVSLEECRAQYGASAVSDRMLCAGVPQGGQDACQGDSGGPLVVRGVSGYILAGATSWGNGCARPGYAGVYARVAEFRSFIANSSWV